MILSKYYHRYEPASSGYGVPIFGGAVSHQNSSVAGIFWYGYDYTVYKSSGASIYMSSPH